MQTNFIRLNLLKFSTEPFNGFTPKLVKMICSPENINLILRLFTLLITQNINFNQSLLSAIVDYLSRFINRGRLLFLITNCRNLIFLLNINRTNQALLVVLAQLILGYHRLSKVYTQIALSNSATLSSVPLVQLLKSAVGLNRHTLSLEFNF